METTELSYTCVKSEFYECRTGLFGRKKVKRLPVPSHLPQVGDTGRLIIRGGSPGVSGCGGTVNFVGGEKNGGK